jgi:O-antigen/teichoic acid export membrane protein
VRTRQLIVRNILSNWSSLCLDVIVAFVIAPFLVHRLDLTNYGLWTVIGALTGYFGWLDLGVRTSVSRYIAFYRARDIRGVNSTFNAAALLLCGVGTVALLGTLSLQLVFFQIYDVPEAEVGTASLALLLVGLNLAVSFPLTLFEAALCGFQRFDLNAGVDMGTTLLRAGLTFLLIGSGFGLVALGAITLSCTLACGLAKILLTFREEPGLRLGWWHCDRATFRELFGYSFWQGLIAVSRTITTRFASPFIGALLGLALVTPYRLAAQLVSSMASLFGGIQSVLVPLATELQSRSDGPGQRRLFLEGTRYCTALALFFVVSVVLLARPFFSLWIGPRLADAPQLVTILACGEFLVYCFIPVTSTLLGMARHRPLALLSWLELLAGVGLSVAVVRPYGLVGICTVQAVIATLCRGIVPMVLACRILELPVAQYLGRAFLPALACAALPAVGLASLVAWHVPASWLELVGYGVAHSLGFMVAGLILSKQARSQLRKWNWRPGVLQSKGPAASVDEAQPIETSSR